MLEIAGPVPRLTPSVAEAIRAAATSADEPGTHVCGLLVSSSAAMTDAVVDQVELLPCYQGAGHPLAFEELTALRDRVQAIRAQPQRRIIGLLRTFSQDPLVFSSNENSSMREMVPGCGWLLAVKAFAGGDVRARAFRLQSDGCALAADFPLGGSTPSARATAQASPAAARMFRVIGAIPPAAAAVVAVLTIVAVTWMCIRLRPAAPPSNPGIRVGNDGDLLGLSWDRGLPAVQGATGAVLHIDDGGQPREVRLNAAQVANGLVLYRPASGDVSFRLEIYGRTGQALRASVRWIDAAHAVHPPSTLGAVPSDAGAKQIVEASHPGSADEPRPPVSRAVARRPAGEGVARFVVKTPGVRLAVRSLDRPRAKERPVTAGTVRLPEGHWVVYATAPGYEPLAVRFLVNTAGPADVLIRLRERQHAGQHHSGASDRLRAGT